MLISSRTGKVVVRVAADLLMFNAAVAAALMSEILLYGLRPSLLREMWWPAAAVLTVLGPVIFYLTGVYTKARSYSGRYKALLLIQAGTLAYGGLAFVLYVLRLQPAFPRFSLFVSWAICLGLLLAARLWATVWKAVVISEAQTSAVSVTDNKPAVLVIGGGGYIGSAVLPKLLASGYRVRLLDCFLFGKEPILPLLAKPNLEVHTGDFRNVDTVVAAMRDMNAVIHLGGLVGDPACAVDEELTMEVNLIATRMIAQVALGNRVSRFIFASSCSVYGVSDEFLTERSRVNPVSLYARTKLASEKVLVDVLKNSSCAPVILRFGTIYGLSGRTRFDLVVNVLAARAVFEGEITVQGREQWRPFLHVHDAAAAVVRALEANPASISSVVFNVGSDEQNKTLGQIGELIQSMVPGCVLRYQEDGVDRRNYRVDFRRIREELGFQHSWTLNAGVQQILDAILSGRVVDYKDPKYSNVKVVSAPVTRRNLPVSQDWLTTALSTELPPDYHSQSPSGSPPYRHVAGAL